LTCVNRGPRVGGLAKADDGPARRSRRKRHARRASIAATRIAIALSHPAYDCVYLALALAKGARYATADDSPLRKLAQQPDARLSAAAVSLADAALRPISAAPAAPRQG
jgi:hypothetical protein